jgi:hypothetical protein
MIACSPGSGERHSDERNEETKPATIEQPRHVDRISPHHVDEMLGTPVEDVNEALSILVSFRYFDHLDPAVIDALTAAWEQDVRREWNAELMAAPRFRTLLGEILFRHDPDPVRRTQYLEYLRSALRSGDLGTRSVAALSLGFIGTQADVSELVAALKHDEYPVAIQAGIGLTAMGTENATAALDEALATLMSSDDPARHRIAERVRSVTRRGR